MPTMSLSFSHRSFFIFSTVFILISSLISRLFGQCNRFPETSSLSSALLGFDLLRACTESVGTNFEVIVRNKSISQLPFQPLQFVELLDLDSLNCSEDGISVSLSDLRDSFLSLPLFGLGIYEAVVDYISAHSSDLSPEHLKLLLGSVRYPFLSAQVCLRAYQNPMVRQHTTPQLFEGLLIKVLNAGKVPLPGTGNFAWSRQTRGRSFAGPVSFASGLRFNASKGSAGIEIKNESLTCVGLHSQDRSALGEKSLPLKGISAWG